MLTRCSQGSQEPNLKSLPSQSSLGGIPHHCTHKFVVKHLAEQLGGVGSPLAQRLLRTFEAQAPWSLELAPNSEIGSCGTVPSASLACCVWHVTSRHNGCLHSACLKMQMTLAVPRMKDWVFRPRAAACCLESVPMQSPRSFATPKCLRLCKNCSLRQAPAQPFLRHWSCPC